MERIAGLRNSFRVGITWIVLSYLGFVDKLGKHVPECVARGIQLALAFFFLQESLGLYTALPRSRRILNTVFLWRKN